MAKYNVKMSCGHEQEINLFGKNTERARKIEYLKRSGTCTNCGPYSKRVDPRSKVEKEYDDKMNEGGEGYNPYRDN